MFVIQRAMLLSNNDEYYLKHKFDVLQKIYDETIQHYNKVLSELYSDEWFKLALKNYDFDEIDCCIYNYKLNEYDIHEYLGILKNTKYINACGINILQKLGSQIHNSIKKIIYKRKFIKKRRLNSFEDKRANSGIIFNDDTVKVMGRTLKVKKVRKKDFYLQEAMQNKIKYCRIVRKTFKFGDKYFLQIVMDGDAPEKLTIGEGRCGIDEGISTCAVYNNKCNFIIHNEKINKYNKEIKKYSKQLERRLRLNNPDAYNANGTIKKGARLRYTHNAIKALIALKNAYRKKTLYLVNRHGKNTNKLIESANIFIKEPMNYKGYQKRSNKLSREEKISLIKGKEVHKYKRKKRYGTSINNNAPGKFNKILEDKVKKYGGEIVDVELLKYKASQYNHVKNEYIKPNLNERTKLIGKDLVQRDLYSAYLLYCYKNKKQINKTKCKKEFNQFLEAQEKLINEFKIKGFKNKNFGEELLK